MKLDIVCIYSNKLAMKIETVYSDENEISVVVGENAQENTLIVKQAHQNDTWFHYYSAKSGVTSNKIMFEECSSVAMEV